MALSVENLHKRGSTTAISEKLSKAGLDTVESVWKKGTVNLQADKILTDSELKQLVAAMAKYNFPIAEIEFKKEVK
jgi:hypothetical protein